MVSDWHTAAFSILHPILSGKGSVINPTEQRGQSSVDLSFSWGHLANLRDASSFNDLCQDPIWRGAGPYKSGNPGLPSWPSAKTPCS